MGNLISCRSCRDGRQVLKESTAGFHVYASFESSASPSPIEARDDDNDVLGNLGNRMATMRLDSPRCDVQPPCGEARRRRPQQRRIFTRGDSVGADPSERSPHPGVTRGPPNRRARTRRRSLRGGASWDSDLRDSLTVPAVVSFQTVSFSESEDRDGDDVSVCTIDRDLLADERDAEPTPEDLSAMRQMVKEFWARPLASGISSPICVPVSSYGDAGDHEVCDSTVCVPIEDERSPDCSSGSMDPALHGRFVPHGRAVVTPREDEFGGLRLPFEGYRRSSLRGWEGDFGGMEPPLQVYRRRRSLGSCAVVTGLLDSRENLMDSKPPFVRLSHSHGAGADSTPLGDLQFCCSDLSDPKLRLEGYRRRHSGESPDDVADFPSGTVARAEVQAIHEGLYLFHRQNELDRERRKSEAYPRPRRPTADLMLSIPPLP